MMKKRYIFLLMTLIVLSVAGVAYAGEYQGYSTVSLVIDGKNIQSDVPGILMSDRTMVPIRVISESLNATVNYDEVTNNVIIVPNGTQAPPVIPAKVTGEFAGLPKVGVIVNGKALHDYVPPVILNGRTLVPVRMVAEALGANVQWDAASGTVKITSNKEDQEKPPLEIVNYWLGESTIGEPKVHIIVKNVSSKDIDYFEVKILCYDAFGKPTSDEGSDNSYNGIAQNAFVKPGQTYGYNSYWILGNHSNTVKINALIIEVHFTDGSTWSS
jgi:hypothetical protein